MTTIRAQSMLFSIGETELSKHSPPVVRSTGLVFEPKLQGNRVTGTIQLAKQNPRRRVTCKVDYRIPESWSPEHHLTAVRIACHWFRDIGGFQTLRHSQLCHIVKNLEVGENPREIHEAIAAYANSEWHKKSKKWTTIEKFFMDGRLGTWIDTSEKLQSERVQKQNREAEKRHRAWLNKQYEKELKERQVKNAQSVAKPQPPAKAQSEFALDDLICKLPQQHRWVIPTLLKKDVSPKTKKQARQRATEIWSQIRSLIPEVMKQRINVKVQIAAIKSGIEPSELPEDAYPAMQLSLFLDELKKDFRQPMSFAHCRERALKMPSLQIIKDFIVELALLGCILPYRYLDPYTRQGREETAK